MKFINDHRTAIIIGICAALIAALLIRFGIDSSRTAAVEDASLSVMTPVQRFFKNIGDNVYDVTHSLGLLKELRGRVDELTLENAEYEKAASGDDLAAENDRLKRMLELRNDNPDLDMTAASVAADEPSNWFSGFTIDKGRNSGISEDNIVISGDGFLIGKVVRVGTNWSSVMTITDPGFSAGVMVERSRDLGIAEGDTELREKMQFRLSFLSRGADIREGDYVTTTGLGGIFPAGFRLGKVLEIGEDTVSMTQNAIVGAGADLSNLRDVFVITNNADIVLDEENANMSAAREKAEQEQAEIDRAEREKHEAENKDDDQNADENSDENEDIDEDIDETTDESGSDADTETEADENGEDIAADEEE